VRYLLDSIYVAMGAAVGANARYWISYFTHATQQPFPWPTLLINILGSMLLGAFTAASVLKGWGPPARLVFAVGVCGGFTTFSTFSFEVLDLFYEKSWRLAGIYAVLSLILSVGGCLAGGHLARVLLVKQHERQAQNPNPFAK